MKIIMKLENLKKKNLRFNINLNFLLDTSKAVDEAFGTTLLSEYDNLGKPQIKKI